MKNWLRAVLLLGVLGAMMGAIAQEESYDVKARRKLGIGLGNIVSSWLEIPKTMINTYNQTNFWFGISGGLLKGLVNTGGRVLTGTLDVLTFYVPTQPVPQPALVWEDFDADTHYGQAFRLDTK
ncbi:MAG: exosortase system-associated protein, TIGR04073 family [Methylohalobius sp.]|nr:exosortase system-associated protein, TIGR04073 family [Methylohalobius sp.]